MDSEEHRKRYMDKLKADPERWAAHKARKKAYDQANAEAKRAQAKKWKGKNKEKVREYKRAYRLRDPERAKAKEREKYQRHRQKNIERERRRWAEHGDEMRRKVRERRLANPERFRDYQRSHKVKNRASWALSSTKKQAKAKGLEFDLDLQWFKTRLEAGVCEMSGLPFEFKIPASVGGRGPNAPSIDRIDPKGPYTKANCRMILWWINRAMIDLGDEYCLSVFRAIFVKRGEMLPLRHERAA